MVAPFHLVPDGQALPIGNPIGPAQAGQVPRRRTVNRPFAGEAACRRVTELADVLEPQASRLCCGAVALRLDGLHVVPHPRTCGGHPGGREAGIVGAVRRTSSGRPRSKRKFFAALIARALFSCIHAVRRLARVGQAHASRGTCTMPGSEYSSCPFFRGLG